VHLWHGEADTIVPLATARYVAGAIPKCSVTYCPGEGHLSVLVNRLDEILETVAAG
jgi:pimeloyl-ACP methyl ester carboxylesterase